MIYIVAPFNLAINTTSRNRILSFYHAIKRNGLAVKFINPPLVGRDREVYLNGTIHQENVIDSGDLYNVPLQQNLAENVISALVRKPHYKMASAVLNLIYLVATGKDFNYPTHSLESFFEGHLLSKGDVLIASAPSATLFIAARKLAEKHQCKLILDYRDPWTYGYKPIDSMPLINDFKKLKSRAQEDKGLEFATLVNCDSESVKQLFPARFHHKINPILNGANLQAIDLENIMEHFPTFRIIYLGTIYNDQLLDETFFKCIRQFIAKNEIAKGQMEVLFVGSARNQRLKQVINQYDLKDYCQVTERMEISKAMELAYTASAFLHLKYGNRAEVDTSKHLDYLALQKAVLLPMTDHGNVASLIRKDNAGYVCESVAECLNAIEELWQKHQSGKSMKTPRPQEFLYSISRDAEAQKFVDLIKKHCLS